MKFVVAISSILMVIGLAAAGLFFLKNQSLEKSFYQLLGEQAGLRAELADAQAKNTELDKDLIFYKSPALKKEAELLRFKLNEKEKALASSKKEAVDLRKKIASGESKFPKAKVYLDVIDEVQKVYLSVEQLPVDSAGLNRIEAKVSALNSVGISSKWLIVKDSTDLAGGGWAAEYIGGMLTPVIANIRASLR